ncbi:conserved exported hypothetical protein [Candidatus Terasakiella magnetica]|uniref:Solute-binding protein family 3/N-terminal domain-containing protein n=1 Tax=Candidatus Terasakiella magnetica TaxID=1867952 RepID=A0A1C3RDY4_9PROT|nr:hypothetical protein [Candidatus Terasakiella magnetica]SCA55441.1 conserved exported hypothetical protein [Candidatus Terasakiella magnetica]
MKLRSRLSWAILLCMCLFAFKAVAQQPINVGLTSVQPPFVLDHNSQKGLVYDLLGALNEDQRTYKFTAHLFPAKRLLATYDKKQIDLIAFNDVKWGWLERGGQGSLTLTDGKDLFVELKEENQHDHVNSIGAVRGFHYAFAQFDIDKLAQMPNVTLVNSESSAINILAKGRVHKAISSEAYLNWVSVKDPTLYRRLNILPKADHTYNRQFIVMPNAKITKIEFDALLKKLKDKHILKSLFAKYGLDEPPLGINYKAPPLKH